MANGLALKGPARLDAADIEPWLMTTSVALPTMGIGTPVELEADIDYAKGVLALNDLTGTINEGALSGAISVALDEARPQFSGQLTLDELNLEPFAAMVLGQSAFEGTGEGWPSAPFAPAVSAPSARISRSAPRRSRPARRSPPMIRA